LFPPKVTPSAGGSLWRALIGGAVNSSFTILNGGTNYTYPPLVTFEPPPMPGLQATGYCALTSGVVTSVTLSVAGAGYIHPPALTFQNDPREVSPPKDSGITTGYGASAVATLTGAGTLTGLILLDQGNSVGSTPTLAFSGGAGSGAAATITTITAAAPATFYAQQM
jgi:hypothetical protein